MITKTIFLAVAVPASFLTTAQADPMLTSWFTQFSSQYARIYSTTSAEQSEQAATTWNNGTLAQTLPAYAGIQEVDSSSNWVYVRSTGLGSHIMGPWYLNAAHTQVFPNLPVNQQNLYRIPRTPAAATNYTINGGGDIGFFVDGVAMFNSWDAFAWNGTTNVSGLQNGAWNRDAYTNEGVTFDAAYAHQQNTGTYHYHANPIALRYLLGDHVTYNSSANTYAESTNVVTQHSPILGWVGDGYPVYGPYGYSNPLDTSSGLRRMISGYVARNGLYGTDNLSTNNASRATLPAWAQRAYHTNANVTGPVVTSTNYFFGMYMEDYDYLGDHGYTQGEDFDLDEHNGRFCVTPDFPQGKYCYFVAIASDGTPVFPYNIGRAYYGQPTGGNVSSVTESVTTNYLGGTNLVETLATPTVNNGTVTLAWSAVEGGSYQIQTTTNLSSWAVVASNVSPGKTTGTYTNTNAQPYSFYRIARTAVASYSPVSPVTGTLVNAPGGTATVGETITVTITLPTNPPLPPVDVVPTSVTLAGTAGTGISRSSDDTVQATFVVPSVTGPPSIVVTFNPAPTYTIANALTVNN